MNSAFFGTWNLDKSRSTGQQEFAKALGIPDEQYQMLEKLEFSLTISQEGDAYKFDLDFKGAIPKNTVIVTPGTATEVTGFDGSKAQLTTTIDGDAVKESYTSDRGNWTVTRTVSGNEQKVVSVTKDITLTQFLVKA